MKIKGMAIGDIHFGIRDSAGLYSSLNKFVLERVKTEEGLNIVNINGDYFDRKLMLTENSGKLALAWMDELANICRDRKIALRIIKGTESHDLSQLDNFLHYEKELDCKIISKVEVETLFGCCKVLYVPEEYPEKADAYLSKLLKEAPYDLVHGHGTWSFTAFGSQIENAKSGYHSAPIFYAQDFEPVVKGPIIFGHIHNRISKERKIFYTGSFYRWSHGENEAKGFIQYTYDTDTHAYSVDYIDNTDAPAYKTIKVVDFFNDNMPIESIVAAIKAFAADGHVRVSLDGIDEASLALLQSSLSGDSNIKLEKDISGFGVHNEQTDDLLTRYGYILNKELPISDTIRKYCLEEYNEVIDTVVIENMLRLKKQ